MIKLEIKLLKWTLCTGSYCRVPFACTWRVHPDRIIIINMDEIQIINVLEIKIMYLNKIYFETYCVMYAIS